MSLLRVLIVFSFLYLTSGEEIVQAKPFYTRLVANVGSEVEIPCAFTMHESSGANTIDIEWVMIPERGGAYIPILRHKDIKLPNQLNPVQTPEMEEDCSFTISPILLKDSGTYVARLIVDNIQRQILKRVKVHVITGNANEAKKHHRGLQGNTLINTDSSSLFPPTTTVTSDHKSESQDFDSDVMYLARMFHDMKENGSIPLVATVAVLILLNLILVAAAGIYFGISYCNDKTPVKDILTVLEEGRAAEINATKK
uniref:Uncharacterized protein n=1 Tax=Pyxicephalus adspersus TaxID=30357 RepID=A0AAV2ZGU8_PYXAD|nr:TPA: hypothetical protein GDO54_003818 [Pyxicephalus adspersus]